MTTSSKAFGAVLLILLPSVAVAETDDEKQACMSDAFRLCSEAIPDRHSVFLCLMDKKDQLNSACREVMERHAPRRHHYSGHASQADEAQDENQR